MNSLSPEAENEAPTCASLREIMKLLAFLVLSPAAERRTCATPNSVCGSYRDPALKLHRIL